MALTSTVNQRCLDDLIIDCRLIKQMARKNIDLKSLGKMKMGSDDEENLLDYVKPVSLYMILGERSKNCPYFLRRCLNYIIQAKKENHSNSDGTISFNYMGHRNKTLKVEVVKNFSCPFCSVLCGNFEGLQLHLTSSHDVFDYKFRAEEDHGQEVDVSLKHGRITFEDGQQWTPFTFRSKRRRPRQTDDSYVMKPLHVRFLRLDINELPSDTEIEVANVNDESISTEPTTQPAIAQSSSSQPAMAQSSFTQPAIAQSSPTQPAIAQSGSTQPAIAQSSSTQPAIAQSGSIQPAIAQSSSSQPAIAQSGSTQPAIAQSSSTQPAIAQTSSTQPAKAQSSPTQPAIAQSGSTQPAIAQSSPTQTEIAQSCPTQPAIAQSGSTQPAIVQSSETQEVPPVSRRKKFLAERAEAKRLNRLNSRQFYHSRTMQPMTYDEVLADEDSEEVDDEANLNERLRLERNVKASKEENRYMYHWNIFVRKQRVIADGHVPWACEAFIRLYKEEIKSSNTFRMWWTLFCIKLYNHGLVCGKTIDKCSAILLNSDEAGPSNNQQSMEVDAE